MATITWDSKLAAVAGPKSSKIEKAFGFRTVGDLLRHYPRRYVEKGKLSDPSGFTLDEHVTIIARVISSKQIPYQDRRRGGMAYRLEVVLGADHRVVGRLDDEVVDHQRLDRVARLRDGTHPAGAAGGFEDEVDTSRTVQLAGLREPGAGVFR